MDGWRFDWRYAAAGLFGGTAMGVLTGLVIGGWLAVDAMSGSGAGVYNTVMFLILVPLYGAFIGGLAGGVLGLLAGAATGLTVGGLLDRTRARRRAFWTTLAIAMACYPLIASLGTPPPSAVRSLVVVAVPALLGAYLMSRATESIIGAAEQRLAEYGTTRG